jgi:hypothetical protein
MKAKVKDNKFLRGTIKKKTHTPEHTKNNKPKKTIPTRQKTKQPKKTTPHHIKKKKEKKKTNLNTITTR